jgi:cytosine/adenosine deaminase-related metal-dependent hydrolase
VEILSADWVLPVERPPIENGAVAIEDGRIAAVATCDELGTGKHYGDAAIVPGFVNAHSHLEYAVYAGFGDGLAFVPWIVMHVERKRRIGWDEHLANARAGVAECLRSGITTVGDASYSGAAAVACAELGLRGTIYLEVFGRSPEEAFGRFEASRERARSAFSERIRLGISPHTPFNITDDIYRACVETGLPIATHLSESEAEVEWLRGGTGAFSGLAICPPCGTSGIRRLADAGLLGPQIVAAHCVQVDDDDIALLAEHDVGVAHCPRSNALLGCGIAPLAKLRAAGLRVGIGTDSPASTPSFDFFEEMRAAIYMARARERRPDALSASEGLELGTLGSARALGLDAEVGSLAPGKRADLVVVSLADSPFVPWEDPAAAVVLGGSPARVVTTFVDGEVRYDGDDRRWLELHRSAASARRRLLSDETVPSSAPPAGRLP